LYLFSFNHKKNENKENPETNLQEVYPEMSMTLAQKITHVTTPAIIYIVVTSCYVLISVSQGAVHYSILSLILSILFVVGIVNVLYNSGFVRIAYLLVLLPFLTLFLTLLLRLFHNVTLFQLDPVK